MDGWVDGWMMEGWVGGGRDDECVDGWWADDGWVEA